MYTPRLESSSHLPSSDRLEFFTRLYAALQALRDITENASLAVGFKINSPVNQLLASGRFEEVVMSTKPEQQRPMPTRKNGRKSKPISRCDDEEEVREEIKTS
jgi:hypothetical protein